MPVTIIKIVLWVVVIVFFAFLALLIYAWNRPREIAVRVHCESKEPKTKKILYIGNSLTFCYDSPSHFVEIFRLLHKDEPIKVCSATGPGYSLLEHLSDKRTMSVFNGEKWDYVILQEGSGPVSVARAEARDSIRQWLSLVAKQGGKPFVVMIPADKGQFYLQSEFSQLYRSIGRDYHVEVLPVGDLSFFCQLKCADINLYEQDNHHPSLNGAVLYAWLTARTISPFPAEKLVSLLPVENDGGGAVPAVQASIKALAPVFSEWEKDGKNLRQFQEFSDDGRTPIGEYWMRTKQFEPALALYEEQAESAKKLFAGNPTETLAENYWILADALARREKERGDTDREALLRSRQLMQDALAMFKTCNANASGIANTAAYIRELDARLASK